MNDLREMAAPGESREITLATFNINGLNSKLQPSPGVKLLIPYPERHREICKRFESSKADIISFQEVFTYSNLRLLRNLLPSYPFIAFRRFIFGPRGGLVIFSKLPIKPKRYSSFSWAALSSATSRIPKINLLRSSLKGVLTAEVVGAPLTLINTHVIYNPDFDYSPKNRFYPIQKAQLDTVIRDVMTAESHWLDRTVVVCGDLNIQVGSELSDYFLERSKLVDLFASDRTTTFHNDYVSGHGFKNRIDYILSNTPDSALNAQRIMFDSVRIGRHHVHLSDHVGLQVTLKPN